MSHSLSHDLDPNDYAPFDLEQIFAAHNFLFRDQFQRFDLTIDWENHQPPGPDLLEAFVFYVETYAPESEPQARDDYSRLFQKMKIQGDIPALYSLWVQLFPDPWWTYLNWGYFDFNNHNTKPELHGIEGEWRYAVQLYYQTIGSVDLSGKDILEIGSGRGGNCNHVAHRLGPRSVTGVDVTASNVLFCRRVHQQPNLRYLHGRAEALPIDDASIDAIINVESCQYYETGKFVREVNRVLRPGGSIMLATYGKPTFLMSLKTAFEEAGLRTMDQRDITINVYAALDAFDYRDIIARHPTTARKELYADVFEKWHHVSRTIERKWYYYRFHFQKP